MTIRGTSMAGGQASENGGDDPVSRELDAGATTSVAAADDIDTTLDELAKVTAGVAALLSKVEDTTKADVFANGKRNDIIEKVKVKGDDCTAEASVVDTSDAAVPGGELSGGSSVRVFYSDKFLGHKAPRKHVECPERLKVIKSALENDEMLKGVLSWAEPTPISTEEGSSERRKLVLECVREVHTFPDYLEELEAISANPGGGMLDGDTYVAEGSYEIALLAVSSWLDAVDSTMATGKPSWALARPPGHHATKATGMGFCLLSNAAIAAFYALRHHGVENVSILDFDVHRGNGTDHCVRDEARIRFASTHEYPLYPGGGDADEKGPLNTILNVPLLAGTGMAEYREIIAEKVLPFLMEKNPGLLIISAGFDALDVDPLAFIELVPEDYEEIVKMTVGMMKEKVGTNTRIVLGLEGGYDLGENGIGAAAKHATRGLLSL